ncbi:TPA: HNH endonuclease signature motif containing protein, partial [Enterobacter hormaechei]
MKMPSRNCPELTAEMVRELLEYDPTTGLLTWKTCRKKVQKGSVAGSVCGNGRKLYVKVRIGRLYRAHRLIWLLVTGEWPKCHIDHVDNDGTNNRWSNLR